MGAEAAGLAVSERDSLARARRVVLAALGLQLLVLLVTGAILFFTYVPSGATAWAHLYGDEARSVDLARTTTTVHRWAARSALLTAVAAGVLVAMRRRPRARRRLDILLGGGLVLAVLVGSFTGSLLPWDQLALWSVTVGANMRGFRPLIDGSQVRFVLMDGAQIAPRTIVRWLLVHTMVVGSVVCALLVVAWRSDRSRQNPT